MQYDINTFADLMEEISYSWDGFYELEETSTKGVFNLNKLYIFPDRLEYKTSVYTMNPLVYKKFLKFFKLLQK